MPRSQFHSVPLPSLEGVRGYGELWCVGCGQVDLHNRVSIGLDPAVLDLVSRVQIGSRTTRDNSLAGELGAYGDSGGYEVR